MIVHEAPARDRQHQQHQHKQQLPNSSNININNDEQDRNCDAADAPNGDLSRNLNRSGHRRAHSHHPQQQQRETEEEEEPLSLSRHLKLHGSRRGKRTTNNSNTSNDSSLTGGGGLGKQVSSSPSYATAETAGTSLSGAMLAQDPASAHTRNSPAKLGHSSSHKTSHTGSHRRNRSIDSIGKPDDDNAGKLAQHLGRNRSSHSGARGSSRHGRAHASRNGQASASSAASSLDSGSFHSGGNSNGNSNPNTNTNAADDSSSPIIIHSGKHQRRGSFLARMKTMLSRKGRSQHSNKSSASVDAIDFPGDDDEDDHHHQHHGSSNRDGGDGKKPPERSRSDTVALFRNRRRTSMESGDTATDTNNTNSAGNGIFRRKLKGQQINHDQQPASPDASRKNTRHSLSVSDHFQTTKSNTTNRSRRKPRGRRSTMDLGMASSADSNDPPNDSSNNNSTPTTSVSLRTHRRSISIDTIDDDAIEEELETNYIRRANDAAMVGDLDAALDISYQAYNYAKEQKATLAKKTELLCSIFNYHIECMHRASNDDDDDGTTTTTTTTAANHTTKAKFVAEQIKSTIVQLQWFHSHYTQQIFQFILHQTTNKELALLFVSSNEISITPMQKAQLHYDIATTMKSKQRYGEIIQHFHQAQNCVLSDDNNEAQLLLLKQIRYGLSHTYLQQQKYDLAYNILYNELLPSLQEDEKMNVYTQIITSICIPTKQYDMAFEYIDIVLASSNDDNNITIRSIKADLYYRIGKIEKSYHEYKSMSVSQNTNPSITATIYYKLGKICIKLHKLDEAKLYIQKELRITIQTFGPISNDVSRIYHDLAKLEEMHYNNLQQALYYYEKAYQIEVSLRKSFFHNDKDRYEELVLQCKETKQCQGNLHYKLGNFERALEISIETAEGDDDDE